MAKSFWESQGVPPAIDIDPETRSGVPVLKGTRFPVSHLLAEIANDRRIGEIANDWDLDIGLIKEFIQGLAISLDRPYISRHSDAVPT